jgi:hypothetical protein
MPETVKIEPDSQLPGVIARAIGIITSPRATYEKVVRKPKVIGILALVALIMGGSQAAFMLTPQGQGAWLDKQAEQSEKTNKIFGIQPTAEQTAQQEQVMKKMAPYVGYGALLGMFVFLPIFMLIMSGIYWAIFNAALGGTASFRQVMSVLAHSAVISSLGAVFGMIMAFALGTITNFPANVGLLLPFLNEGGFAANLVGVVDLFIVWSVIVTAIGFGVLYRRSSRNIAITLLCIGGLFAVIFASLASR